MTLRNDILNILHLFAHEHPAGVPHDVLLRQLMVEGYWPGLKGAKGINIKVYQKAERQLQDSIEEMDADGLLMRWDDYHFRLTEPGEAIAIAQHRGMED